MSNCDSLSVWVGDLDGYIDIDAIGRDNERESEQERLDVELDEIGDLPLLSGKAISARKLYQRGILPSEWRHALHQAEMLIEQEHDEEDQQARNETRSPESSFVKGMLDLGRSYAIARYARWEHLDYSSALSATLPYGIRALVNELLMSEGLIRTPISDVSISEVLIPYQADKMTAYSRTTLLQKAIHRIAEDSLDHPGGEKLNRDSMRVMLSLTRLYFSIIELRLISIDELRSLQRLYDIDRAVSGHDKNRITMNGRLIRSWRLRHIQPLLNLYPYAIRHGLKRALEHKEDEFNRETLVNEFALAQCGIIRMRRSGREKTRSK